MIIRNPYGFFAKHHKIIHLLLLIPLIYLLFSYSDIARFFKDYISAGYHTPENNITETYINGYIFLVTFIMSLVNGTIFIILYAKKKNNIFYGISAIYFLVMIFFLLLFGSSMSMIEKGTFSSTFSHFVRDCASFLPVLLYIIIFFYIVKGVGFNFKTLRFDGGDNLKITEEDEEDIEINLGTESGDIKRTSIHIIRELKYYVLENAFVMKCLAIIFLLIVGYNLYLDFQVYNKTYSINQAFQLSNFTVSIKDSYITNVDYRGIPLEDNKKFLVIKIAIQNNGYDAAIDRTSFRVLAGDTLLYPSYDKVSRFIDIGAMYSGETIQGSHYENGIFVEATARDYVFAYELTDKQVKASYQLRILSSLTQTYDDMKAKYKKITIKPTNITKTQDLGTAKVNQEINLKDTMLGDTTYKLESYDVATNYQYTYEVCNNNKTSCYNANDVVLPKIGNTLLILHDVLKWDETSQYYLNSKKDFYADFVTISYTYKNKNTSASNTSPTISNEIKLNNITPRELKNEGIAIFEVPTSLDSAVKIDFIIKVRNKTVTLNMKS